MPKDRRPNPRFKTLESIRAYFDCAKEESAIVEAIDFLTREIDRLDRDMERLDNEVRGYEP